MKTYEKTDDPFTRRKTTPKMVTPLNVSSFYLLVKDSNDQQSLYILQLTGLCSGRKCRRLLHKDHL